MDVKLGFREVEFELEGAKVTAEIKSLSRKAMIILTPLISSTFDEEKKKDQSFLLASTFEMQEAAVEVFPDHVRNIKGITVNNGEEVTVDHLCDESVFATLVVEIILKLFSISSLTREDEKNLNRQSASITEPTSLLEQ